MGIDWKFDLSTLIQTLVILGGGYAMLLRSTWESKAVKRELHDVRDQLEKLAHVIIQQAVQTKEIENLREQFHMLYKTIEELRRGNGWIRGRGGIDGEYDR